MTSVDIPGLERPAFFDGQQLTADDLTAVQSYQRELRWLHNRSLHDWGVVFGLPVDAGGATSVTVGTGYALDCAGRELLVDRAVELPVPPVAGPESWLLTLSYRGDADIEPELRQGSCGAAGAVRRREAGRLRWQDPTDADPASRYRPGLDVVLAAADVANCRLAGRVSLAERRQAGQGAGPFVAAGATRPGRTRWRAWPEGNPVGVAATIDTAAAGFRAAPSYHARVAGERRFSGSLGGQQRSFVLDGYAHVAAATASSFELRVLLLPGETAANASYVVEDADLELVVEAFVARVVESLPDIPLVPDVEFDAQDIWRVMEMLGLDRPGGVLLEDQRVDLTFLANAGPFPFMDLEPLFATVERADFAPAFQSIADRHGLVPGELIDANGIDDRLVLRNGGELLVPGAALELNPAAVLVAPELPSLLRSTLAWHVVWMGVES